MSRVAASFRKLASWVDSLRDDLHQRARRKRGERRTAELRRNRHYRPQVNDLEPQIMLAADLYIDDLFVWETDGYADVSVYRSQDPSVAEAASVNYSTVNDSATSPDDYQGSSGTVNFAPARRTKQFKCRWSMTAFRKAWKIS